jgi:hypothetical protein
MPRRPRQLDYSTASPDRQQQRYSNATSPWHHLTSFQAPHPRRRSLAHLSTRRTLGHRLTTPCCRPLPHGMTLGPPLTIVPPLSIPDHFPLFFPQRLSLADSSTRRTFRPHSTTSYRSPPPVARHQEHHVTITPTQAVPTRSLQYDSVTTVAGVIGRPRSSRHPHVCSPS